MVRVDEQVSLGLDAWVETDVVKSRSEAAALFIREGLEGRRSELDQLNKTLDSVSKAKEKIRKKAQQTKKAPAQCLTPGAATVDRENFLAGKHYAVATIGRKGVDFNSTLPRIQTRCWIRSKVFPVPPGET